MNRKKLIIRNTVIILILFFLILNRTGLYLTPLSAHENSERSAHYGPSKIVHEQDFGKGRYYLCTYDKWVSCNTIKKELLFFWRFGNQVTGFENDVSKPIDYSWGATDKYHNFYGIRNDENVAKVEITLENGKIYSTSDFYEDLLLISWAESDNQSFYFRNIKAYDINNNIIYEEEF